MPRVVLWSTAVCLAVACYWQSCQSLPSSLLDTSSFQAQSILQMPRFVWVHVSMTSFNGGRGIGAGLVGPPNPRPGGSSGLVFFLRFWREATNFFENPKLTPKSGARPPPWGGSVVREMLLSHRGGVGSYPNAPQGGSGCVGTGFSSIFRHEALKNRTLKLTTQGWVPQNPPR